MRSTAFRPGCIDSARQRGRTTFRVVAHGLFCVVLLVGPAACGGGAKPAASTTTPTGPATAVSPSTGAARGSSASASKPAGPATSQGGAGSIVGIWKLSYGNPQAVDPYWPPLVGVAEISLSGGTYTEKTTTPTEFMGIRPCGTLPVGTVLATFAKDGANSYSGQYGLWNNKTCAFASWRPFGLTVSGDGNTITSTSGMQEVFTRSG